MNIYKIIGWFEDSHADEYVVSDKLYDNDEFKKLCHKCMENVKKIHNGEVDARLIKQHLMLHDGFKDIEVIQTFTFDEKIR